MNMEKAIEASDFEPYQVVDLNKIYGHYKHYKITGNIPQGVAITADGNVTVNGVLQEHTKINATGKITLQGNVGEHAILRGKIIESPPEIKVGSYGSFEAFDGYINLQDIGTNNHLKASGYIELLTAGANLHATAQGEVSFRAIGDNALVVASQVSGGSTGKDSDLTATKGNVCLSLAGNGSRIFSAEPAQIVSQGSNVTLNEYFAELPVTSVSTKDNIREDMVKTRIIYDAEEKQFIIPRTLSDHIDATPFIDAALDVGCSIKNAPASDKIGAAYITIPYGMNKEGLGALTDLATVVNNTSKQEVTRG